MAKKAKPRYCVCGKQLVRSVGETNSMWQHRRVCQNEDCWRRLREITLASYVRERSNEEAYREVKPWPEGIRFGALDLPKPMVLKLPRPETHRPYGTSAAWAVGGGSDA